MTQQWITLAKGMLHNKLDHSLCIWVLKSSIIKFIWRATKTHSCLLFPHSPIRSWSLRLYRQNQLGNEKPHSCEQGIEAKRSQSESWKKVLGGIIWFGQKWTWRGSHFHSTVEIVNKRIGELNFFHFRFRLKNFGKFVLINATWHHLQLIEGEFGVGHGFAVVVEVFPPDEHTISRIKGLSYDRHHAVLWSCSQCL